jgi:hypothetical protein
MANGDYELQSDLAKRAIAKAKAKGFAGRWAEASAEGWAEGFARGILIVLEARGLPVSDEIRTRILACTDVAQLHAWIRKAVSVTSVDELF